MLKGKTALVTGASKGLGKAITIQLANEGADIIAQYNSGDMAETEKAVTQAGARIFSIQADLSISRNALELANKAIEAAGNIDILVNNAGVCEFVDFFNVTEAIWDFAFNVNIKSMFLLTQKIAENMVKNGMKGRIINVSSVSAYSGSETQVHYCAAKGAVNSFTKAAAVALGQYGITVNAVLPGPVPTKHNSAFLAMDDVKDALCERIAMGSYGQPKNIAGAVSYFASELAGWTTGSLLVVDGGYMSK